MIPIKLLTNVKIIRENVNRIGIGNKKEKILYPSCYVVQRDGEYFLAHFKELLAEDDGGYDNLSDEDIKRRNAIAYCLHQWGLITVDMNDIDPHNVFVFVLSHKEKANWRIKHKINSYLYEED